MFKIENQVEALNRLLVVAMRDTGQSRRVKDFLLAWWNADTFGSFDFRDAWSCDQDICEDMIMVFALVVKTCRYPDAFGYERQFEKLVKSWHPDWQSKASRQGQ